MANPNVLPYNNYGKGWATPEAPVTFRFPEDSPSEVKSLGRAIGYLFANPGCDIVIKAKEENAARILEVLAKWGATEVADIMQVTAESLKGVRPIVYSVEGVKKDPQASTVTPKKTLRRASTLAADVDDEFAEASYTKKSGVGGRVLWA